MWVIESAGAGGAFGGNESKLLFKGIGVAEVPLTYGRKITDDLAIGGNIKYMKARIYNTSVKVFDTNFEDALDNAMDDYKESQNVGIDLGLLYRFGQNLRVGLVGRNLNSPKFDMKKLLPGDDDYLKEEAQIRAGAAYRLLGFITVSADIDLTKNDTNVSSSYKSQNRGRDRVEPS